MQQFLLNHDGTIPNGLTKERLDELGLTPVLPSARPDPQPGMAVEEAPPEQVGGQYVQRWKLVPVEPEPLRPLDELKAELLRGIDAAHAEALLSLTGNPTQAEQTTWAGKVLLAEAIQAGTPLSQSQLAFLGANGIAPAGYAQYAQAVLAKSAAYWTLVGIADKVRSDCKDRVVAAKTHAELAQAHAANLAQSAQTMAAVAARGRA